MAGQQLDEAVALRMYCKKQFLRINQRKDLLSTEKHKLTKYMSIRTEEPISDHIVPKQLICTLRLKAFKEEMRKGAEQDFHDSSRCTACLAKQAELARNFFIRKKITQLKAQQLEDKIQSHLYKDSVCLIGEILRNMPKLSDDPAEIWQKLRAHKNQTLHGNK